MSTFAVDRTKLLKGNITRVKVVDRQEFVPDLLRYLHNQNVIPDPTLSIQHGEGKSPTIQLTLDGFDVGLQKTNGIWHINYRSNNSTTLKYLVKCFDVSMQFYLKQRDINNATTNRSFIQLSTIDSSIDPITGFDD